MRPTLVYIDSYRKAEEYTKNFFASLHGSRLSSPEVYDAVQAAVFNAYLDGYNEAVKTVDDQARVGKDDKRP